MNRQRGEQTKEKRIQSDRQSCTQVGKQAGREENRATKIGPI